MRYDTDDYARSRLLHTIVLHEGKPVEVGHIEGGKAILQHLKDGTTVNVQLSEIDLTPIRLGYFNHGGDAHYLKRLPKRNDWRQGLRGNNVNMPRLLNTGVIELCKGTYPSFEEACDMVEDGHDCVAFSRQFAIGSDGDLEYRGSFLVGHTKEGDVVGGVCRLETPVLVDKYKYLAEALKEAMDEH